MFLYSYDILRICMYLFLSVFKKNKCENKLHEIFKEYLRDSIEL